jgi:hypothetical protein
VSLAAFEWTDRARPIVELGVGDTRIPFGQAQWDVARWDTPTASWAGTEPTWFDITCDTRSYTCSYGRQRTTERFTVGVAQVIVDNATGWADPNAVVNPNTLTVRPGRAIRMGVVHAVFGVRWLFRGFIDAMTPTYDPQEPDTVQLDCIDALGEVNRAKFVPSDLAPAGETVTGRIDRLLTLGKWPDSKRDLQPTSDTLVADDMSGQLADLLGQAADSNGGSVFGDYEARVAYRPRDWQTFPPGTPVDGVIGNVDPGDVCPTRWERPFNRADIATRVIVGREAPPAQGPAGPQGPPGSVGIPGPSGPKGDPGQGFTYTQEIAPTGAKTGETWWNTATGVSYLYWNDGTSSQWVQFAPGANGVQGPPGATGPASTVPGPKGDQGLTGPTGATGTAGATGAKGDKGDPGTPGATGATGAPGPKGDPGATGAQGPTGTGGSGYTFKQDTTPTPTVAGQTWWNSSTGTLSGTTWVAVDRGGGVLVWVQDN